jgi:hypothetical protein
VSDLLACDADDQPAALMALLASCITAATLVAQAVGAQYFTHSQSIEISVGA